MYLNKITIINLEKFKYNRLSIYACTYVAVSARYIKTNKAFNCKLDMIQLKVGFIAIIACTWLLKIPLSMM